MLGAQGLAPPCPRGTGPCAPQVMKKTRFPRWHQLLEFELAESELGEAVLTVEVWDWDIVGKNDFLGQVRAWGQGAGAWGHPRCSPR